MHAFLTFLPKLTHAAARSLCDSWASCYKLLSICFLTLLIYTLYSLASFWLIHDGIVLIKKQNIMKRTAVVQNTRSWKRLVLKDWWQIFQEQKTGLLLLLTPPPPPPPTAPDSQIDMTGSVHTKTQQMWSGRHCTAHTVENVKLVEELALIQENAPGIQNCGRSQEKLTLIHTHIDSVRNSACLG